MMGSSSSKPIRTAPCCIADFPFTAEREVEFDEGPALYARTDVNTTADVFDHLAHHPQAEATPRTAGRSRIGRCQDMQGGFRQARAGIADRQDQRAAAVLDAGRYGDRAPSPAAALAFKTRLSIAWRTAIPERAASDGVPGHRGPIEPLPAACNFGAGKQTDVVEVLQVQQPAGPLRPVDCESRSHDIADAGQSPLQQRQRAVANRRISPIP